MRIVQIANFIGPTSGGMKTAVEALGRGYSAAGIDRLLVVPGDRDRLTTTAEAGDVVQLRAPRVGGGYRLLVEPWRVVEVIRRFGPSSLEVSDKSTLLPVTAWTRRNDIPTILFSHERLDAMLSLRTGWAGDLGSPVSILNRVLVRQYDRIVVTSAFAGQEFLQLARTAQTPVHRVPLGVDLDLFRPQGRRSGAGPLRLVHAGRLSREKSPGLAVATAVELHRRGVPVRLDVYGDGPQRAELERAAGNAWVVFHGHVAERQRLSERLAAADIALSVCPGETFGLSVLEALACGTPVVTADVGGARELVDAASGDWGAPDPRSLADAVLRVAARPEAVRRGGARRRAREFPWARTVEAMLELHAGSARSVPAARPA